MAAYRVTPTSTHASIPFTNYCQNSRKINVENFQRLKRTIRSIIIRFFRLSRSAVSFLFSLDRRVASCHVVIDVITNSWRQNIATYNPVG